MTRKKKMELDIINPNAAGIDVGSRSHYVAVGQSLEDVKEFGVYAEDLKALCEWLISFGITSAAMESTGDYWQNLYAELMKHYKDIEAKVKQHTAVPSFCSKSQSSAQTIELKYKDGVYTASINDSKGVLSNFNFSRYYTKIINS